MGKKDLFGYVDESLGCYLEQLFTLLRQPSISTQNVGISECSSLLVRQLGAVGCQAQILPTDGYPVVYGEVGPSQGPSLLVYGHYDVQPPEPLDEWLSLPFEPEMRGDRIYARGSADDKGQFFTAIAAIDAWRNVRGSLPVRVKFLIEGEEEIGSPNLGAFLRAERERLASDLFVLIDGNIHPKEIPLISLGNKGMTYVELEARGPKVDVGCALDPIVPNPAWRLAWALSTLRAPDGCVLIEGFYDDVRENTSVELAAIDDMQRRAPSDTAALLAHLGLDGFVGKVDGAEAARRQMLWPTCSIDGIWGGYSGPGIKTVLPSRASAKLAMRLVPNQSAQDIYEKLVLHLRRHGFGDIQVHKLGALEPNRTPMDNPWVRVVARAVQNAYGVKPLIAPTGITGGSGPSYLFASTLQLSTVGMPCAQFKDKNAHAPNESLTLESFCRGIKTMVALFECMAEYNKEDQNHG